jgi:hypothetical protein
MSDISELSEKFRAKECEGIAGFIMLLEPDEDGTTYTDLFHQILQVMFVRMGVRETTIQDPFAFFKTLYTVQDRKSPFIDEGLKLIDLACTEAVLIYEMTG